MNTTPTLKSTDASLTATFTDEQVTFSGGKFGEHSIWLNVSSTERIKAHWDGYVSQNGAKVVDSVNGLKVGSNVAFYARMRMRTGRVVAVDLDKQEALVLCLVDQHNGTCRYYEYYVVIRSGYGYIRSHKPASLPQKWQSELTQVAVNFTQVLECWKNGRGRSAPQIGWVRAKSYPKGRKRQTSIRWVLLTG